ncbi:protein kinase [Cryptosporidium ryanae]|uniref:protein kinase n=1 Tax=Cryptosporidium ryanae TaxID=515981 RepID=UPI00351A7C9D|nr:protein kinase [Cryptosporidium ryanae]
MASLLKKTENVYFLLQVSPIVQIHTLKSNVRYRIGPEDGITDVDISYPDPPECITSSFDLWIKNEDREFRITRKSENNLNEPCKYYYKDCITGSYLPIPLFPDIIVVSSGTKLRVMTSQPNECNIAFILKSQDVSEIFGDEIRFNTEIKACKININKENSQNMKFENLINNMQQIGDFRSKRKNDVNKSYIIIPEASLGKGGNGEVFLGINRETFEFVAVKSEVSGSLSREADYLDKCRSEYVVRKLDWFQNRTDNREYLIMELFHGGTIRQLLRFKYKNGLPINAVRNLMYTLLVGVNQMHSKGVVHRDLKTANLMLADVIRDIEMCSSQMKICDLGNSGIPVNGKLKGHCCTCFATAPEIYTNNEYDEKVDMWSIGTIFYELITGKRLIECNHQMYCDANEKIIKFEFKKLEKQLKNHVLNVYNISELNWFDDALDLFGKLLDKSPSNRISAASCLSHSFFLNSIFSKLEGSWRCITKLHLHKILDENVPIQHEEDEVKTFIPTCKCFKCLNNNKFNYTGIGCSRIQSGCFSTFSTIYSYCSSKNNINSNLFNKQVNINKLGKQILRSTMIHRNKINDNSFNEQNLNTQNK